MKFVARLLFPLVLNRCGLAFLILPILLLATLLSARVLRRARSES